MLRYIKPLSYSALIESSSFSPSMFFAILFIYCSSSALTEPRFIYSLRVIWLYTLFLPTSALRSVERFASTNILKQNSSWGFRYIPAVLKMKSSSEYSFVDIVEWVIHCFRIRFTALLPPHFLESKITPHRHYITLNNIFRRLFGAVFLCCEFICGNQNCPCTIYRMGRAVTARSLGDIVFDALSDKSLPIFINRNRTGVGSANALCIPNNLV